MHVTDAGRDEPAPITFRLELWQQPFRNWIIAVVYHWYDMVIFKVPGVRWLDSKTGSIWNNEIRKLPWSLRQDIRGCFLTEKNRVVVAAVDISRETYEKLYPAVDV